MMRIALVLALFLLATPSGFAQKISWSNAAPEIRATVEPATARPGQTVIVRLSVLLRPEHSTYPTVQPDPSQKSSRSVIQLPTDGDLIFVAPVKDPAGYKSKPAIGGTLAYYPGGLTWEIPAVVSPTASRGTKSLTFKQVKFIVCDAENCLPPKAFSVSVTFDVAGEKIDIEAQYIAAVAKATGGSSPPTVPGAKDSSPPAGQNFTDTAGTASADEGEKVGLRLSPDRDYQADIKAIADQMPAAGANNTGFWVFIGTAVGFGLLTLLTPCVFPMVPITVSVFIKQGEKNGTKPLIQASIYAATIVVLLTVAALTLLTTFSRLAVHPTTNVLLGALFVALALSLFGLFELTLPSSLANFFGRQEGRGGYVGTVFMAMSFTVVSFTCVAPFLGGFSGMAESGNFSNFQLACGALAFACSFALPFFLLALFPSLLKKLPKSGDWLNTIKVTMGFLELAAALKFFRTAELRWLSPPEYFTYDFVLALWVVIAVVMGLYLLGMFRMGHDYAEVVHVGPLRLMFALASLGFAVYLTPALFSKSTHERNRPAGVAYAWVDAFLLPEPSAASELGWSGDLRRALDDARAKGGYVFVDFTGETCANCRLNEKNVFPKGNVADLLKTFTRVRLYTDTVPDSYYEQPTTLERRNADAKVNFIFERNAFGAEQLPLYVILKPEAGGKTTVVGVYHEGVINDVEAFVEFLKQGVKGTAAR